MRPVLLAAICLLAACGDDDQDAPAVDASLPDASPLTPTSKLDVLFLIDDSGGMPAEQQLFAQAASALLDRLATSGPKDLTLHLAVATSSVASPAPPEGAEACLRGDGSFFTGREPCLTDGNFLRAGPGHGPNFTGELVDAVACLSAAGVAGCGVEQHLEGMRLALTNPATATFIRPDAALLLVIVADEDDCSASDQAIFDPQDTATYGPVESFRCTQ